MTAVALEDVVNFQLKFGLTRLPRLIHGIEALRRARHVPSFTLGRFGVIAIAFMILQNLSLHFQAVPKDRWLGEFGRMIWRRLVEQRGMADR